jgi:hypothetical protein
MTIQASLVGAITERNGPRHPVEAGAGRVDR